MEETLQEWREKEKISKDTTEEATATATSPGT